jgi:hypothetical protein
MRGFVGKSEVTQITGLMAAAAAISKQSNKRVLVLMEWSVQAALVLEHLSTRYSPHT